MPGPEDKDLPEESFLTKADKFLRKWTGGDYYERKNEAAKEGFRKAAPKTAAAVEKTAETLGRGAEFESGGGPLIGMAKRAKTAVKAKDVLKGSARESWARGPARPAADLKKGDARSAAAAGKSVRPKTFGQKTLMDKLNRSRDANEAARTKAARIERNSPTVAEQGKIGRAKRNDATPPTASEMARIGRAKRNDSSLTVADRARLGRAEKNSPSILPDPAKAKAARMKKNSPVVVKEGRRVAAAAGATALIAGGYYGSTRWKAGKSESKSAPKSYPGRGTGGARIAPKKEGAITQTEFAKKRQGQVKADSTANQGKKKDKPTKMVGFKGNWKGAAPYRAPKSLQEAVRRGLSDSYLRGSRNKRDK